MAVDYIVHYPCRPKKQLGSGDLDDGTVAILESLKARDRARAIEELAEEEGKEPGEVEVTHITVAIDGTAESPLTHADLLEQASTLAPFEGECTDCPANCLGRPFGCFGDLHYPIHRRSEAWLMWRLQPPGSVGMYLFRKAIRDFTYNGQDVREMRRQKIFFESPYAVRKTVWKWLIWKKQVSSDQLFHAILFVGEALQPSHCLLILEWLGAVKISGRVPQTAQDAHPLLHLPSQDARRSSTDLEVGPPSDEPEIRTMQDFLRSFYTAWLLDVPLVVSR